jgi:hypothetical protein
VRHLTGWATEQIQSKGKAEAGQIYLNAVLGTGTAPFAAITNDSVKGVKENVVGKGEQGGLTEAQLAAFRIFSGKDYGYINPSTTKNKKWLESNKAGGEPSKAFEDPRDPTWGEGALDRLRMNFEGPVHAGMLQDALKSVPPYDGTVYRGWAIDQEELDRMKNSGEYEFVTITSTSKMKAVAATFNSTRPEKPIAVICTIEKSGARDMSKYAKHRVEDEVTIPGGTRFTVSVSDIKLLPGKTPHGGERYEMKFTGPG